MIADRSFGRIVGMDVSHLALEKASRRLKLDRLPAVQRDRIELIQGSLMYADERVAGFDAATLVEVIEHIDQPRLASVGRAVFEYARPSTVLLTTPNAEYNALFETLDRPTLVVENKILYGQRCSPEPPPGFELLHSDDRFPTTRLKPLTDPDLTLVAIGGMSQEAEQAAPPSAPAFDELASDWWLYFEGAREEVDPRVESFLATAAEQIADLSPANQEVAQGVLESVENNFTALLNLRDEEEAATQELPDLAVGYSIEDLLSFAAMARVASAEVAEDRVEVDREQRVLDGATRRRDAVFNEYFDASAGDERWLAALRLVQARTAQAISARRLERLTNRLERHTEYANALAQRVTVATDRLEATADEDELTDLIARVDNGVPDRWVSRIVPDPRDWRRAYACFMGYAQDNVQEKT